MPRIVVGLLSFTAMVACSTVPPPPPVRPCPALQSAIDAARPAVRDRADAATLLHALVCDVDAGNSATVVRAHLADSLLVESQASGDPAAELQALSGQQAVDALPRWAGETEQTEFTLQSASSTQLELAARNEACFHTLTFRHQALRGWRITAYRSACD